jgi:hypothetical protein
MAGKKQHYWIDRRHARIGTGLTCLVATGTQGKSHQAQMLNLSAGGLKFSCPQAAFIDLLPESLRTPGLAQDVEIEVQFQLVLPGRADPHTIKTAATIIHTERLAQDCYHVGARFNLLPDTDTLALDTYISHMEIS